MELADEADFCSFCGIRLDKTRLTPPVAPPVAAEAMWDDVAAELDFADTEPDALSDAVAGEASDDSGDDEEPTVRYSSAEFQRLTGDMNLSDLATEATSDQAEPASEEPEQATEQTTVEAIGISDLETETEAANEHETQFEAVSETETEIESKSEIVPEPELEIVEPEVSREPETEIASEVVPESEPEVSLEPESETIVETVEREIVETVEADEPSGEAEISEVADSEVTETPVTETSQETAEEEAGPEAIEETIEETADAVDNYDEPATIADSFPGIPSGMWQQPVVAETSEPAQPEDSPSETTQLETEPVEEAQEESAPAEELAASTEEDSMIDEVSGDVPPAPNFLAVMAEETPEAAPPEVLKGNTGEERTGTDEIEPGRTGGSKKGSKQSQVLTEGTLLYGRYEIVRKIGGGGMGAVYLATDRNLGGALRAVKEMVQTHIEEDMQEKALADFKRESMMLTSLEHPCIPTIYDYFYDETAARFYLVMKYISGGDLAARLRSAPDGRVDEKSVTEWAAQTADVLDYLHSREPPIVYRDLKPSNLMIDGNTGRIMLIDFGIARWVTKDEKGVTAVGTMGYAPPELFSGNVEPRSDIYSLGATMFHLMTGADPQSNPLLIFDFSKHPRPRQVNPNISNEMEQILMRSVEYNVELRYTTAGELREALINHLERVRYGQLSFGQPQSGPPMPAPVMNPANQMAAQNLVFCGFCGEKIIANDVFCPYCGAKQAVADQQRVPVPFGSGGMGMGLSGGTPQRRVLARVSVLGTGSLEPPMYDLEKESNIVGRRDPQTNIFPEVDLSKFDPQTKISRRHARIWKEGEHFLVEDLGSSNGTVVVSSLNEAYKLTPHQPQVLVHGSKLVVGDTTLHFMVG